jgi:hypothetical protein
MERAHLRVLAALVASATLTGCATPGPIEQAHLSQIRYLREQCMNRIASTRQPSPLLRASAIHQCNAWSRSKVL